SETRTPPPALIHKSDPGGGVMFQWNTRIATVFIVSAALATTAAAQPQKQGGKPGGAPAARAAPAPAARAAPAPHPPPAPHVAAAPRPAPAPHAEAAPRAAPHIAAQRAAPHAAAPHVSAQRAAPRQVARPSGGPPASAMARHAPTPRTSAAPT